MWYVEDKKIARLFSKKGYEYAHIIWRKQVYREKLV